jgi:hypothetical protein
MLCQPGCTSHLDTLLASLEPLRHLVGITVYAASAPIPVAHAKTAPHIPGNRCRDTRLCRDANTAVPRAWEAL